VKQKKKCSGWRASSREPGVAELRPPNQASSLAIEHAQILSEQDIRVSQARCHASINFACISDLFFAPARLGMERLAGAYAWIVSQVGAIICGGSDAPVERGNR